MTPPTAPSIYTVLNRLQCCLVFELVAFDDVRVHCPSLCSYELGPKLGIQPEEIRLASKALLMHFKISLKICYYYVVQAWKFSPNLAFKYLMRGIFYFFCDFVEDAEIVDKGDYLFDACLRSIILLGFFFLVCFFGVDWIDRGQGREWDWCAIWWYVFLVIAWGQFPAKIRFLGMSMLGVAFLLETLV